MNILFQNKNRAVYDIITTVLYTSEFNYNNDAVEYLNNDCLLFEKNGRYNIDDISIDLLDFFLCTNLKNKSSLTKADEIKINVLGNLMSSKKVFVFLNILTYLDDEFKRKLFLFLKRANKTIINYTTDIEEVLYFDYLVIIHNNEVVIEGATKEVLKEEKIIKKLGFKLPFIVELSSGLKYYGLVNKLYYDNESLVDDLWK